MIRTAVLFCLSIGVVFAQSSGITVSGDVASPLTLSAEDIAKLPRETVTIPDPRGNKIVYEGVTLRAVLEKAGAPAGKELRGKVLTTYVLAKARDGYQTGFSSGA